MVEVGVSQNDRVNAGRRHRRGLPVALPPFLGALEHAAIDEHLKSGFTAPVSRGVDQVLGTGDRTRRAQKLDVCQEFLLNNI